LKLHVISVGNRLPPWVQAGVQEYLKRMPHEFSCSLREIKPEARNGVDAAKLLSAEGARIGSAIPQGALRVTLDERGRALTTKQLAEHLSQWQQQSRDVAFLIGGADGLDAQLKQSADLLLALSAFTLPHALARLVLVEQLYRAVSLLRNHPYHRE